MNEKKRLIYLGIGIGIGIGVVAVATSPAWLPATKAKALQVALIKTMNIVSSACT